MSHRFTRIGLLTLVGLGFSFCPVAAEPSDALEQLLAETPTQEMQAPAVPRWLEVNLSAPQPPILGEPFRLAVQVTALLADLPDARFVWKFPRGVKLVEGSASGPLPLKRGEPMSKSWTIVAEEPLGIVEGQIALGVTAHLPKQALLAEAGKLPAPRASMTEAEVRRQATTPQTVSARLEFAAGVREGFVGFSPLVWGTYTRGDGFYVGAGSFMDTNFAAHDLVADAERHLLSDSPMEALALLARARADLRPGVDTDPLLRWEALNAEAIALWLTGKKDLALKQWQLAAEDRGLAEVRRYAFYNLGEAARRDGKLEDARRCFAESCRDKPAFRLPCQKAAAAH